MKTAFLFKKIKFVIPLFFFSLMGINAGHIFASEGGEDLAEDKNQPIELASTAWSDTKLIEHYPWIDSYQYLRDHYLIQQVKQAKKTDQYYQGQKKFKEKLAQQSSHTDKVYQSNKAPSDKHTKLLTKQTSDPDFLLELRDDLNQLKPSEAEVVWQHFVTQDLNLLSPPLHQVLRQRLDSLPSQ